MAEEYTLDLRYLESKEDFFDRMQETFQFPEYYGRNLDATWDLLSEKQEMNLSLWMPDLEEIEDERLHRTLKNFSRMLEDLEAESENIHLTYLF